jgi:hypothetical protein
MAIKKREISHNKSYEILHQKHFQQMEKAR